MKSVVKANSDSGANEDTSPDAIRQARFAAAPAMANRRSRRLLIVQFGDYAEAVHRFASGGEENYLGQRYTVDYVAGLAAAGDEVRVLSIGDDAKLERLPSGVESQGVRVYRPGRFRQPRINELIEVAEQWRPSHLLLQTPLVPVIRWAITNRVETLPLFADSFRAPGLRRRIRYRMLANALNHPAIRWISNHGPNACLDLVRIGVDGRKVVPFDWPSFDSPSIWPAKTAPAASDGITLTYVGQIAISKGVSDLIEAIALAWKHGDQYRAVLVGRGPEMEAMRLKVRTLGLEDAVAFAGAVPRRRVMELMHAGDVVVVPSRHEYPEGMPQTIYEGLVSRSPVAVSDHPMFVGRIEHRESGVVFKASDAASLYHTIRELVNDRELYERLSRDSDHFASGFHGPLKWDELITRWLRGAAEDDAWLRQFAVTQ
jgi:glycosyltransferase involved in cell wall biosynthesis